MRNESAKARARDLEGIPKLRMLSTVSSRLARCAFDAGQDSAVSRFIFSHGIGGLIVAACKSP